MEGRNLLRNIKKQEKTVDFPRFVLTHCTFVKFYIVCIILILSIFRVYFHEFILQKIREKPKDKVWIKDVSNGRFEHFGNVNTSVNKIASGLSKLGID